MNRRRVRTVSIISAGLLAGSLLGGVAGAEDPPPAASGTVACRMVGRMTFTTPMATGGTTATTANFKGLAVGCTGTEGGAAVKRGVITASVDLPTNDCAALVTPGAITLAGSVRWRTTAAAGPIADTTVSLGAFTADPTSLLKPLYTGSGDASAGSFSGQSIAATLSVSQTTAVLTKQCAAARLRGFTVRASQSTVMIGTPAPV